MRMSEDEDWQLYADVSALSFVAPYRVMVLRQVVDELPHERLVFGSDYPIPVTVPPPGSGNAMDVAEWADAVCTSNPLDKSVKVTRALGFREEVLTNAETILRFPPPG
jgi:hypothetical protein